MLGNLFLHASVGEKMRITPRQFREGEAFLKLSVIF